jgi:hypothetical protein
MEMYMTTVAKTYDERMALIKAVAERRKKMAMIKAKSKIVLEKAPKAKRSFMNIPDEDASKNPNYYTDEAKYANQYYGETFRQTTKYDNDWGDY